MFLDLITALCDLVYPPRCFVCKSSLAQWSPKAPLCPLCAQRIPLNVPPFCPRCSRSLGKNPLLPRCRTCRREKLHFDFAWAACRYQEPLRGIFHAFKYEQRLYLHAFLAQFMISFIERYHLDIYQFDALVPVPLFSSRLRERGYNQSFLIAKSLSQHYKLPLAIDTVVKIKNTPPQAHLSQKERWTNLGGAFRIKNSRSVKDKKVLIIDDLLTTGATVSEIARTLKEAGTSRVGVLAIAIT